MRGCLKDLGCLALFLMLIIVALAGWFLRDTWMPMLPSRQGPAQTATWEAPSTVGARRTDSILKRMQRPNGPAFVHVPAADVIAFMLQEFARTLPPTTDSIQATVIGERLHVRARVRTKDLGGQKVMGALAWMLESERERVEFGGTLRVIRPGFAEYQVKTVKVRDYALPRSLIPTLVEQLSGANRSKELSPDGLALTTPPYIGDVRIADGRVTVYRRQ